MTMEAVAFPGSAAALRRQWHQTRALPAFGRANHQEMVTTAHLAVGKHWFVGRDQGVCVDWIKPVRDPPSEGWYGPDVIGKNVDCHAGTDGAR
jgi:hypothetical protein